MGTGKPLTEAVVSLRIELVGGKRRQTQDRGGHDERSTTRSFPTTRATAPRPALRPAVRRRDRRGVLASTDRRSARPRPVRLHQTPPPPAAGTPNTAAPGAQPTRHPSRRVVTADGCSGDHPSGAPLRRHVRGGGQRLPLAEPGASAARPGPSSRPADRTRPRVRPGRDNPPSHRPTTGSAATPASLRAQGDRCGGGSRPHRRQRPKLGDGSTPGAPSWPLALHRPTRALTTLPAPIDHLAAPRTAPTRAPPG